MNDQTPTLTDEQFADLALAAREVKVGPFGPNARETIERGGTVHLTPSEALDLAHALGPVVARMVAEAEQRGRAEVSAAVATAHEPLQEALLLAYDQMGTGVAREDCTPEQMAWRKAYHLIHATMKRTSAALTDPAAAVARIKAEAWDEAVRECHDLGWMHDYALSDVLERNPCRTGGDHA